MAYFYQELKYKVLLNLLERDLLDSKNLPKNREFAEFTLGWQCGYFNEFSLSPIRNDVTVGVDKSKNLASLKGLVEWIERQAFQQGKNNNNPYCQTIRSEGFAARPFIFLKQKAKEKAREAALLEATERYAWVNWWENDNITHSITRIGLEKHFSDFNKIDVNDLFEIEIPTTNGASLYIYLAKIKNEGYLTGGAASFQGTSETVRTRGISELLRHLLAYERSKDQPNSSEFEYMERIKAYGSGERNKEVEKRIFNQGQTILSLPKLEIDSEIDQTISNHIVVYRCRFFNQPEFITDEIKLCF